MNGPVCAPWPNFSKTEADIVRSVLLSNKVNYWTGEHGKQFEVEFAKAMDCKYSIALANGTLALDLALLALKVGVGDEVVVTPRSFLASASVIHNCGATPVFAEVDPVSQNITAETISEVLTPKTKAIMCVHLAGWPCDMAPIKELADSRGLSIIEDCAQAHGAKYKGKSVGSWGDVAGWSFCQDKIMTTGGEGGMVTTNNPELFEAMWAYKDHGKSREKMENPPKNRRFKYVHDQFGSNFRLTEMQCALGRYQLEQMEGWTSERTHNAMRYENELSELSVVRVTPTPANVVHAYYKYYFFLRSELLNKGWDRDRIVEEINDRGGQCFSGTCPEMYREQAFVSEYGERDRLPYARKLGEESLMLTVHPGLSSAYIDQNVEVIKSVLFDAAG